MSTMSQYKTEAQNFLKSFTRETVALAKKQKLPDFSKLSKYNLKLSHIWSRSSTTSKTPQNLSNLGDVKIPSQPFLGHKSMQHPYTFTSKLTEFTIAYYKATNSMWKYCMIACFCCLPIFAKFGSKTTQAIESAEAAKDAEK